MDTLEKVRIIISKQVGVPLEEVSLETRLEDLGDSLDLVEAVFALEEEFGVDIPLDAQATEQKLDTVGDVGRVIDRLTAERDSA